MVKNLNLKFYFFLLLSFFYQFNLNAQEKDSIFFAINFKWNTEKFELNKNFISNKDTVQINLIKFYISNIEFNYSDGTNYKVKNSYNLIDFENENSKIFSVPKNNKNKISKIIFNIGVDSIASTTGAMYGELDVTNGMYWAWQSGYINMKIEGKSKSCKTRKNAFQFHIGGYLNPFYAMKTVAFDTINQSFIDNRINLICDLKPFFNEIDLSKENSIMIPGEQAMKLANQSIKMFSIE